MFFILRHFKQMRYAYNIVNMANEVQQLTCYLEMPVENLASNLYNSGVVTEYHC